MTIGGQFVKLTGEAIPTALENLASKSVVDAALAAKAPLASPAFTGNPTAPTPSPGDNDTSIATTAFVAAAISGGAGGALPLAGGTMTGAIQGAAGTVSAPSLTVSDAGSGFYRTGANAIGMALNSLNTYTFTATSFTFAGPAAASLTVRSPGITSIIAHRISDNANAATNNIDKSRGAVGAETGVINGDVAGTYQMRAHNGSALVAVGSFSAEIRQTSPGAAAMGTRLLWSFTRVGAASITEGMRLDSTGGLQMGGANTVIDDSRHFRLRSYTNATKPSASPAGQLIYISDVDSGKLAQSNGSVWAVMGANPATGDFVAKGGDTMSGPLILNADPSVALGAATKQMVDAKVSAASPALTGIPTAPTAAVATDDTQIATTAFVHNVVDAAPFLALSGGILTGGVTFQEAATFEDEVIVPTPAFPTHAANKGYVDLHALKSGATFTGGVTFNENVEFGPAAEVIINFDPTVASHAATKGYVDTNFASKASPAFTGTMTLNGQAVATQGYVATVVSDYLPLAGGTIENELIVPTPTSPPHAATKAYADTKAPLASPIFTGTPIAPEPAPGTNNQQIATTAFVQGVAGGGGVYLPLTGGTISPGPLIVPAPSAATHAARRADVDLKANIASPALTGTATLNGLPLATQAFVDNAIDTELTNYLPLSGGTISPGPLTVPVPSAADHAARKADVDLKANIAAPALTGAATLNGSPIATNASVAAAYVPLAGGVTVGQFTLSSAPIGSANAARLADVETRVRKIGDTMSGNLSIPDPTSGPHAANRQWTEAQLALKANLAGPTFTSGMVVKGGNIQQDRKDENVNIYHYFDMQTGREAQLRWRWEAPGTPAVLRWSFGSTLAGNWSLQRYSSAGALASTPLAINLTSGIIDFDHVPTSNTPAAGATGREVATAAWVLSKTAGVTFASDEEAAVATNTTKVTNSKQGRIAAVVGRGNNTFSEVDATGDGPLGWSNTGVLITDGGIYGAQRLQALVGGVNPALVIAYEDQFIPVDTSRLYVLQARGITTSSSPIYGVGLVCYDNLKNEIDRIYPAAIGQSLGIGSRVFSGIVTGESAVGAPLNYNMFPNGTRYVKRTWHVSGTGTANLDYMEFREVPPGEQLSAAYFGFRPGANLYWNGDALNAIFDHLISDGGVVYIPPGLYDISDGINKTTPSLSSGYSLIGAGPTTRIRRGRAWWGDFIEVYGDRIEISNFEIDGNRLAFPETDPDPLTNNQLGHMLSLRNGSHQKISKMIVKNWSRNTGIFLDAESKEAGRGHNFVDDCYLDGANYAGNGILFSQQFHSGMRGCRVRRVNNSAARTGGAPSDEFVPTPCLALQLKYDSFNCSIENCIADECRTGLKVAGKNPSDGTSVGVHSCRFTNIGIKAALSISPHLTSDDDGVPDANPPLQNNPVDFRTIFNCIMSGVTIDGTSATSPSSGTAAPAVYLDGLSNRLEFTIRNWDIANAPILMLDGGASDNIAEFSQYSSNVTGAVNITASASSNNRNVIEVGTISGQANNTVPGGYAVINGTGNVVQRKVS